MRSYYALSGAIRYYGRPPENVERSGGRIIGKQHSEPSETPFDLRLWREPPHLAFANLSLNLQDLGPAYAFTKRYGFIPGGAREIGDKVYADVPDMMGLQELIRNAWAGETGGLAELRRNLFIESEFRIMGKGFEIALHDIWTLMGILFMRDYLEGRARVCASPDCRTPYFLAVRKGQKYCSDLCAVRENVRRFRERQKQGVKKAHDGKRGKHAKAKKA